MPWIIRTSGTGEAVPCGGIGPLATGIVDLPLNTPIQVKALKVRHPSADGSNNLSGSKVEVVKLVVKTADEIIRQIRTEFSGLEFKVFESHDEAKNFLNGVPDDWALLGVDRGASAKEIRQAWIKAQQLAHPDKGGSLEQSQVINAAYKRLKL